MIRSFVWRRGGVHRDYTARRHMVLFWRASTGVWVISITLLNIFYDVYLDLPPIALALPSATGSLTAL